MPLAGGDVTVGVVRVGDTVRRPRQEQSAFVAAYLQHLERAGFDGAPRFLGVDEQGRDVLDFLPGEVPGIPPEPWSATDEVLAALGGLVRRLHEASAGWVPDPALDWFGRAARAALPAELRDPAAPELVSHADITPQNVVFRAGLPVGLVDFDLARPGTRVQELLNTAMWWVPLQHPDDRPPAHLDVDVPARLRLFLDAYGATPDQRARLLEDADRAWKRSWLLMKRNAAERGGGWARMWAEGVGDTIARRRLWLRFERESLDDALR